MTDTPDAPTRTWDVILPSGTVASTHPTREDAEAALQELAKEAAGIPTAGWFLIVERAGSGSRARKPDPKEGS